MWKYIVIAVIAAAVLLLLRLLKKQRGRSVKNKEMAVKAQDKLREEALDRILLNENAGAQERETFSATPFEVSYDGQGASGRPAGQGKRRQKTAARRMLQITEKSQLSARKYMFDPGPGVRIGSEKGKNNIVLTNPQFGEVQCEIREYEGHIYVRNLGGSGRVTLTRGSQRVYVEKKAVEIKSGDELLLADTAFRVDFVKVD